MGTRKRKLGRPTDDPKGERLHLRVSADDIKKLDQLAKVRDSDRSTVVRELVREAATKKRGAA